MNIDKIELEELLKSIKKEKKIEYNDTPSDKQVISLEEKEDASSKENLEIESKFSEIEKEEVSLDTDNEFASKVEKEIESEFSEGLKEEVSLDTDNEFASKVEKEIESEFSEGLKEEVKVSSDIEIEEKEEISVIPIETEGSKKEENIETEQISKISQKIEKEIDAEYHYQQKENIEVYSNEPDKEKNGEVIEEPESNISKKDVEVEEIDSSVEKTETNLEEIDSSVEKTNSFVKKGANEYSEETNAVSKSKENTNIKKGANEYSEETNAVSKSKENTSVSKETKAYNPTANFSQQTKIEYSDTEDWKSGRGDFSIQGALSGSFGGFSFFSWKDIEQAASKLTNSWNYHPISPVKNLITMAEDGVDIWNKFDNFSDTNVLSSINSIVSSAFSLGSGVMGFINQTSKLNSGRYDIMMKDEKYLQEIRSQEKLNQSSLKLGKETIIKSEKETRKQYIGNNQTVDVETGRTETILETDKNKNKIFNPEYNLDKTEKNGITTYLGREAATRKQYIGNNQTVDVEIGRTATRKQYIGNNRYIDVETEIETNKNKEFNPEQNLKPIDESGELLEEKPSARQTKLGDTEFNIEQALKPRDEDGVFKKEKDSSVYLGKSFKETKTGDTNYRGKTISGIEVSVEKDVFNPEYNLDKTEKNGITTYLGREAATEKETRKQYIGNNLTIDIETGKETNKNKEFNPEQNLNPKNENGDFLEKKPNTKLTKLGNEKFDIEQALKPRDEDGVFKKEKDSSVYLGKSFKETKTGDTNYRGKTISGIEVSVEKDVFKPEKNLNETAEKSGKSGLFLGKEKETRKQYIGNNLTIDIETGTDKNKEFNPEIYIDKESKKAEDTKVSLGKNEPYDTQKTFDDSDRDNRFEIRKAEDEINKIAFKPSAPNTLKTEATTSNRTRLTEDINSVGYIYVSPVNTDFLNNSNSNRFIKIPLQSNLISRDDSRKANYTTSSFLSRIGSVKQYTGTESVSYSVETKYFVTSYSNGDGSGYTMRNLQRIESLYKSLVYPSYVDKKSEVPEDKMNESYYTRPPIINIVIGTSNDNKTYPYIDNTEPSTTGVDDTSLVVNNFFTNVRTDKNGETKVSFKDFIVTEVVVEKDYEKTPYYLTEENKNPKDLMGFTVRLTITEIDPNYLGILPTFEDYANFGLRTIKNQDATQNSNQDATPNSNQDATQNSNQDATQSNV